MLLSPVLVIFMKRFSDPSTRTLFLERGLLPMISSLLLFSFCCFLFLFVFRSNCLGVDVLSLNMRLLELDKRDDVLSPLRAVTMASSTSAQGRIMWEAFENGANAVPKG